MDSLHFRDLRGLGKVGIFNTMVVAGCPHAEKARRRADAERYEDNQVHNQLREHMELAQLPVSHAGSSFVHVEDANPTYPGDVPLCPPDPWSSGEECQITR